VGIGAQEHEVAGSDTLAKFCLVSITSGFGSTALTEHVLTMVPVPRSSRCGSTARVVPMYGGADRMSETASAQSIRLPAGANSGE
jgi:hypothetical protein